MSWILKPYIGINDIKFGNSYQDIETAYGSPRKKVTMRDGSIREIRNDFPTIDYYEHKVTDITIDKYCGSLFIFDKDALLLHPEEFLAHIEHFDKDLLIFDSTISSYKIGLAFDMLELQSDEKTFTIFSKGSHDELIVDSRKLRNSDRKIIRD